MRKRFRAPAAKKFCRERRQGPAFAFIGSLSSSRTSELNARSKRPVMSVAVPERALNATVSGTKRKLCLQVDDKASPKRSRVEQDNDFSGQLFG